MSSSALIAQNLRGVLDRVAGACARVGRSPDSVTLVAITKSVGVAEIEALAGLGITHIGENRVDVAAKKRAELQTPLTWHMIGNIQRRKAGEVVRLFDTVDAVDRVEVAEALQKQAAALGKRLEILLEVNVSGEESKHGFAPSEVSAALDRIRPMENLAVTGLMTMAPFENDPERTRPVFRGLATLARDLGLATLSMGMSNDYEEAIEEGATHVRIGSALFEA